MKSRIASIMTRLTGSVAAGWTFRWRSYEVGARGHGEDLALRTPS